jgi:hypothetical protein
MKDLWFEILEDAKSSRYSNYLISLIKSHTNRHKDKTFDKGLATYWALKEILEDMESQNPYNVSYKDIGIMSLLIKRYLKELDEDIILIKG